MSALTFCPYRDLKEYLHENQLPGSDEKYLSDHLECIRFLIECRKRFLEEGIKALSNWIDKTLKGYNVFNKSFMTA